MVVFLIGSLLCGVSQNMIMLITCRMLLASKPSLCGADGGLKGALQGVGGGGILCTVQVIVSDVVTLEKKGTYEGILGAVVSIANTIGPLIGDVFTQDVSWRWCFVS
jgi:MFS family permease